MTQIQNLILAPHADDEVLGCGGTLNKCTQQKENNFVYICGNNERELPLNKYRIGLRNREKEIKRVADFLGFDWKSNPKPIITRYNEYKNHFIKDIDSLINELKPEKVFVPFPAYNQDHKVIYDVAKIVLRPHDKNFFVKKVLIYEQPCSIIWENEPLIPNFFVPIDIDKKTKAYSFYKSQVRDMRSNDLLRAIAKLRGSHANCNYAEAFYIERWVE